MRKLCRQMKVPSFYFSHCIFTRPKAMRTRALRRMQWCTCLTWGITRAIRIRSKSICWSMFFSQNRVHFCGTCLSYDLERNRSKIVNVIDSNSLERAITDKFTQSARTYLRRKTGFHFFSSRSSALMPQGSASFYLLHWIRVYGFEHDELFVFHGYKVKISRHG